MVQNSVDPWPVLVISLCILTGSLMSWSIRRFNLFFFPESGAFISLGIVVGALANLAGRPDLIVFQPQLLLLGFLPIIIADAGYIMNKREFFRNIGIILSLAVFGTLISTLVIGYGLYAFEKMELFELGKSPLENLLFASLISAVDPVATLAIFSSLGVDRLLYSVVFGESVMNDAVAILLYQTFAQFVIQEGFSFDTADLFKAVAIFLGKFVGSLFLGVLTGAISSVISKQLKLKDPSLSIAFIIATSYISYSLSEASRLSGIVGVLFCAITLKHYAYYNMEESARETTTNFLNGAAYLSEMAIYIYLGMAFFVVELEWNWYFIGLSLVFCVLGRLFVFPMCSFANLFREKKIPFNFQVFLWFSGLRGAIAFALVLLLPEMPHKQMVVTTTLVIVASTTFLMGGLAVPVLRLLGIKTNDIHPDQEELEDSVSTTFLSVDKKILIPFLSNKPARSKGVRKSSATSSSTYDTLSPTSPSSYGSLPQLLPSNEV